MDKFANAIWNSAITLVGFGGVVLFVYWSINQSWFGLPIFQKMTKNQQFELFKTIFKYAFIVTLFGIACYTYLEVKRLNAGQQPQKQVEEPKPQVNKDEPNKPGQHPTEEMVSNLPTKDEVQTEPAVKPEQVVFEYLNDTDDDLKLHVFNCYYHYFPIEEPFAPKSAWRLWQFPSRQTQTSHEFKRGTGWFVFFVEPIASPGTYHELGTKMIFYSDHPKMVVSKASDGKYEAKYTTVN